MQSSIAAVRRRGFRWLVPRSTVLFGWVLTAAPATAQGPKPPEPAQYQLPPAAIADLIDAPQTPAVSLSPDHAWLLLMEPPALPPIAELAQPELRLAGLRINPRTNGPSREWYYKGLAFKRIANGIERAVAGLPDDPRITRVRWSPDSSRIAFQITRENGIELWTADVASGQAQKLTEPRLNAAVGAAYNWVSDSRTLVATFLPEGRGGAPAEPLVPAGPTVQEPPAESPPRGPTRTCSRTPTTRGCSTTMRPAGLRWCPSMAPSGTSDRPVCLPTHRRRPTASTSSSRSCIGRTRTSCRFRGSLTGPKSGT